MREIRLCASALSLLFVVGLSGVPIDNAHAQTTQHKKNIFQRHPNATGAAAAYGGYKIAKRTGKNRRRNGQKRNFAQRHPYLTGAAAGMAAHHAAKKR